MPSTSPTVYDTKLSQQTVNLQTGQEKSPKVKHKEKKTCKKQNT